MDEPLLQCLLPNATVPSQRLLLYPCASLIQHLRDCIYVDSEVQLSVMFSVCGKVSVDEILSLVFQSQ